MRKATYIALALCAALCSPTMARAEEINYLDSFTNGIETLKGNDTSEVVEPEREWSEGYKPVMKAPSEGETAPTEYEEGDNLGPIGSVIDSVQYIPLYASKVQMVDMVRYFLGSGGAEAGGLPLVGFAAVLVFVWWGLRKSLRMIMAAFRKGKANV